MKKAAVLFVLAGLVTTLIAGDVDQPIVNVVHGQGGFLFDGADHGEGYAAFRFELRRQGPSFTGALLFAAEFELDYPDIVVELNHVQYARVDERTARFAGLGQLIDQPVFVTALAVDREGTGKADTFEIKLISMEGVEILHAAGELFVGDEQFGEPQ